MSIPALGALSAVGGGGGVGVPSSSATSRSGDASGRSEGGIMSGDTIFNFDGNPNRASKDIANTLKNPFVIAGAVIVAIIYFKTK